MPYNPCGAICDYGRGGYRTKARFFHDSEVETVITWRPAAPDAVHLPFDSAILSNYWDIRERGEGFPYQSGIGEVWDAPRVRLNNKPIPGATGAHRCGTPADFVNGASYNPLGPVRLYDADGLPTCCRPGGGLLIGGGPSLPAGGLLISGATETAVEVHGTEDCATAPALTLGTLYHQPLDNLGTGEALYVYVYPSSPDGTYRLTWTDLGGANPVYSGGLYGGTTCGDMSFISDIQGVSSGTFETPNFGRPLLMVLVSGEFFGPGQDGPVFDFRLEYLGP